VSADDMTSATTMCLNESSREKKIDTMAAGIYPDLTPVFPEIGFRTLRHCRPGGFHAIVAAVGCRNRPTRGRKGLSSADYKERFLLPEFVGSQGDL